MSDIFAKQEKVIVDSLKPVEKQIAMLERAVKLVNAQCTAVDNTAEIPSLEGGVRLRQTTF